MSGAGRIGRLQLDAIATGLGDRDWAILGTLAAFRLATSEQLRRLHFAGHATPASGASVSRRVLARLRGLGLTATLDRRIGGHRAGSKGMIWHLTPAGQRLTDDGKRVNTEPSLHTLGHTLAITEVAVQLREAARTGSCEVIEATPEPAAWRTHLNAGGGLSTLKPDMFAVTAASGAEFEDVWFIEVDRATESLPTIRRKATHYDAYRATGKEQAAQGVFPKVVWLTPDTRRAEQITTALAGMNGGNHATHLAMPLDQFVTQLTGDKSSHGPSPEPLFQMKQSNEGEPR